ncbi:MAG: helix-turn-helix domain-containing protein [Methylohalobius sp.]
MVERCMLLAEDSGNVTAAARLPKISRKTLRYRIQKPSLEV